VVHADLCRSRMSASGKGSGHWYLRSWISVRGDTFSRTSVT
jgi:hypothetical protein